MNTIIPIKLMVGDVLILAPTTAITWGLEIVQKYCKILQKNYLKMHSEFNEYY